MTPHLHSECCPPHSGTSQRAPGEAEQGVRAGQRKEAHRPPASWLLCQLGPGRTTSSNKPRSPRHHNGDDNFLLKPGLWHPAAGLSIPPLHRAGSCQLWRGHRRAGQEAELNSGLLIKLCEILFPRLLGRASHHHQGLNISSPTHTLS